MDCNDSLNDCSLYCCCCCSCSCSSEVLLKLRDDGTYLLLFNLASAVDPSLAIAHLLLLFVLSIVADEPISPSLAIKLELLYACRLAGVDTGRIRRLLADCCCCCISTRFSSAPTLVFLRGGNRGGGTSDIGSGMSE